MIVAITGANGFIGYHLARGFADAGWDVRAIVRRDFASGDAERLVADADVVVHAAGETRAPSVAALQAANVALTQRVVNAAVRGGVGRFVLVSSQAAMGPAPALDRPVTESATPAPVEAYGRAKLDAEHVVRRAHDLPFTIVRPAAVYGPRDRDFLAMFRLARLGLALHPANREQWISIVHVRDVARAVIVAATHPNALGGEFFVANEEPVQWRELFRAAAECAGRSLRADVEAPAWLVRAGAALGDVAARISGRAGLLTSGKAALAAPRFWVCSAERARRELAITPAVPLRRGIAETYHWYLEQGWL